MSMNKVSSGCTRLIKSFTFSFLIVLFFNASSFSQAIYWENFRQTTILNDSLVSLPSYDKGTALSQNRLFNQSNWSVTYNVSFESVSKILGVINPKDNISLANMDLGLYFSSAKEKSITYFIHGKKLESVSARNGDRLRISFFEGRLELFLNEALLFDEFFEFENHNVFSAILHKDATFERMEFITDYVDVFVAEFDTLTNLGSIHVNLPDDAPAGPYHYLIGEEGYVDLDSIQTMINDSLGYPIDNIFFEPKEHSKSYLFEGLASGNYYVSVLNADRIVLHENVVAVNQHAFLENYSNLHKEGDLYISQEQNTMVDYPLFISEEGAPTTYEIKLLDVAKEQYFGYGLGTVPLTLIEDIRYGFRVIGRRAYIIENGRVSNKSFEIQGNTILGLHSNKDEINYTINNELVHSSIVNFKLSQNGAYNLKHGFSSAFMVIEIISFQFLIGPSYNIDFNSIPIDCEEELSDVEVNFNVNGGFFHTPLMTIYNVEDEYGSVIGTVPSNGITTLQGLPPGHYKISGLIYLNSNYFFIPSRVISFTEYFVVGYPVSWVNKMGVEYDPQNESLKLEPGSSSPFFNLNLGHASSNNNITSNKNWIDFKMKYSSNSLKFFNWSVYPESPFINSNDLFFMTISPDSTVTVSSNNSTTTFPFSIDDRFKVEYDGYTISFYRNYGAPLFQINATSNDFERLNVLLASFSQGRSDIYDVYTNMDCLQTPIFAKTERQLKGVRYKPINKKVYFYYEEEYFDSDGVLNYRVVNDSRNEVIDGSSQSLINSYGDNRRSIDVSNLPNGAYILEVENDKKELFYLRFIIE